MNQEAQMRSEKLPATRRSRILEFVAAHDEATVTELAKEFGVSLDTVRRDLDGLDEAGALSRTHGGARRLRPAAALDSFELRSSTNPQAKRDIGRLAAALVEDNETVLINGGTTTLEVARALGGRRNLTVITPSPRVAQAIPRSASQATFLIGGRWHPEFEVSVGPVLLPGTKSVHADTLILGVVGISSRGVSIANIEEAEMLRSMIESSVRVIIVADSSKFGRDTLAKIADLSEIDVLVAESAPDPQLLEVLQHNGVQFVAS